MHNHSHKYLTSTLGRLIVTMTLNFAITIAELIGGILSGSLSLISDALHNFSDGVSVIVSFGAIKLKSRGASAKYTFGFQRAEILAAALNSSVLIIISFYLFYEAVIRLFSPAQIEGSLMIIVASIGLTANIAGTLLLKRDSKSSVNIRSSYLHLFSDAVSSAAVIIGGIFIYLWKIYWIDPLLTILIGLYIIKEGYAILSETLRILLEGAPVEISPEKLKNRIMEFPEIVDIHHVHLWRVGEKGIYLEAHIQIEDMMISGGDSVRKKIEEKLKTELNIYHTTLQLECGTCETPALINKAPSTPATR